MTAEEFKARKLIRLAEEGDAFLQEQIDELGQKFDNAVTDIEESAPDLDKVLETIKGKDGEKGDVGPQGETGEQGQQGKPGINGKNGRDGANGLDGRDGRDGTNGQDGINGKDGIGGKDGSPDTGEKIVEKINKGVAIIKKERVEGLQQAIDNSAAAAVGMAATTSFFNGKRAKNLSIVAGNNITVAATQVDDTVYLTVTSTASGSASFVNNEVASGSGTAFTLASTPVAGSEHIFANGQRLTVGAGNDYTISGKTITTASSWSAGALLADYQI